MDYLVFPPSVCSLQYQTGSVLLRFIDLNKAQRLLALINGETVSALEEVFIHYYESYNLSSANPLLKASSHPRWLFLAVSHSVYHTFTLVVDTVLSIFGWCGWIVRFLQF